MKIFLMKHEQFLSLHWQLHKIYTFWRLKQFIKIEKLIIY